MATFPTIYILDSNLRRVKIVDEYISAIWTERFNTPGDFQLELPPTSDWISALAERTLLIHDQTDEPMIVEQQKKARDASGKSILTIKGRDLTSWLELRVSTNYSQTNTRTSSFVYNAINRAFSSDNNKFPNWGTKNLGGGDATAIDFEAIDGGLLEDITPLMQAANVGLRTRLQASDPRLQLEVYGGSDRSVLFSQRNETLIGDSFLRSSKKMRNCAKVLYRQSTATDAPTVNLLVYGNGGKDTDSGLDRRILVVDARSANQNDYPGSRWMLYLKRLGMQALAQARKTDLVDGEVPEYAPYKYRNDYFLGDTVSEQSFDKDKDRFRVTEYIWSKDSDGTKAYPTLVNLTADTL